MTRKEFIRLCGLLGVSIPLHTSCVTRGIMSLSEDGFKGKVVIIGAGAGGLSAGYLLQQLGIDFEILEASSQYGGRIRINNEFADFPIPLGAEWLETSTSIFEEIVNDPSKEVHVETIADIPDRKFVGYSWFNFYEEYIVPSIRERIKLNTPVTGLDYSDKQITISTKKGQVKADKVIVSVPLKILQKGLISFTPNLPKEKQEAIDNADVWSGFKAFFEFSEQFYEEGFEKIIQNTEGGQKIFYDAAYGQQSKHHVVGLFAMGDAVDSYDSLIDDDFKTTILKELKELFDKDLSSVYVKHLSQNWNKEPYIQAGYLSDHSDWRIVEQLGLPLNNQVYFAGGAYTDGNDWVSVHAAARSARVAVEALVGK